MQHPPPLVAIVDDDDGVRRALRRLLASQGVRTTAYASAEAFLETPTGAPPDCILPDLDLPGCGGLDLLAHLVAGDRAVPVIVMTGFDRPGLRDQCPSAGAAVYLTKPVGAAEPGAALASALHIAS